MAQDLLRRHYEQAFGRGDAASRIDVALRLLGKAAHFVAGQPVKVLDIGGGDMQLARALANRLAERFSVEVDLAGWDISAEGVRQAAAAGETSCLQSICDEPPPAAVGQYDVVLFFEVLEHLVDTSAAVANLRQLMKPKGWLLLSTPNLAGWINRLSLLVGMQPHSMEVSLIPHRFGNPVLNRLLPWGPDQWAAGHLHVFTLRALKEFLRWHGIRPVRVGGCVNHPFDFVSRLFAGWWPGMVGDVVVLGAPGPEDRPGRST